MKTIVIDANIGLSYTIPLPYSSPAIQLMKDWRQGRARIVVPTLWRYEVLSGLRKAIALGMLSTERANLALQQLKVMAFEELITTWEISGLILDWAKRLDQVVAYDAVYLASAEQLNAEFWTADRNLHQAAHKTGATWVHLLS